MSAAMTRNHALLSASTSGQWLHCPPSARLCAGLPDTASDYAEESRLAHAIAALRLRRHYDTLRRDAWAGAPTPADQADTDAQETRRRAAAQRSRYRRRINKLKAHPLYNPEMENIVDTYVDQVMRAALALPHPPALDVEARLDFSAWVPQGCGTVDSVLLAPGVLHIHDLKHGKGVPVKAEGNTQMMLYALGALAAYDLLYDVAEIRMTIVQPRRGYTSTWSIAKAELLRWAEDVLRPAAQLAWAGQGDYYPGGWCRFCRAAATCRARAAAALAADAGHEDHPTPGAPAAGQSPVPLLLDEEIAPILQRAQDLARWVQQLEDYALERCLAGHDIPGLRVMPGRGQRKLDLERALPTLVAQGYDEALFYRREPLPLGEMERIVGKARLAQLCEPYLTWVEGKPTLVSIRDREM